MSSKPFILWPTLQNSFSILFLYTINMLKTICSSIIWVSIFWHSLSVLMFLLSFDIIALAAFCHFGMQYTKVLYAIFIYTSGQVCSYTPFPLKQIARPIKLASFLSSDSKVFAVFYTKFLKELVSSKANTEPR